MNPLTPDSLSQIKAALPAKVQYPSYVAQLPHRFGWFTGMHGDGFQTGSVAWYGEWAREESLLLESMIKGGDWVLDCGSNTGSLTLAFASKVTKSGHVFSFEPQLYPFQCLESNVITNSLSHFVTTFRVALGKETGEIPCPILDPYKVNNFGGCTLVDKEAHTAPTELVPLITIDSLNLPRCDLIKIDVEGMEPDVIEGAFQTISRFQPILWIEQLFHRERSREDLLKLLNDHDYKAWRIATQIYSPRNIRNCAVNHYICENGEPMVDTNVLAIPKDSEPPKFIETREFFGAIEEFK